MDEMLAIVVAVALVGAAGGFALTRYARGHAATVGWPVWLVLPFAVLGVSVFLSVPDGSHTTAKQAHDDAVTSIVIISLFTAPVWFGSAFIGWIVGRFARKRS
jgi:ABC-type transport system involved in cytochrome c biogenesis permease subunit